MVARPTHIGIGLSNSTCSFDAGRQAALNALKDAKCEKCDFAFIFSTVGYNHKTLLRGIQSILQGTPISGCTGAGIITHSGPNENLYTAAIMVIKSENLKFNNFIASNLNNKSKSAGEEIGIFLKENVDKDSKCLFLFPDALSVNMKNVFDEIKYNFNQFLPFIGGFAADNLKMNSNFIYQFHNDMVYQNSIPVVLLSGDINVKIGVNHGCISLGLKNVVTKSIENKIYSINNKAILEFYNEFSNRSSNTINPNLLLHICFGEKIFNNPFINEYNNKYIIRQPLTYNHEDGSIIFPTDIPEGTKLYFMRRDKTRILRGINNTARKLKSGLNNKKPKVIFNFNCAGRGKMLYGLNSYREINAAKDVFDKDTKWFGFYSYGEIAPVMNLNYCHSHTSTLTALY